MSNMRGRAWDGICVEPSFSMDEHYTVAETGVICAILGTAAAVASTIATGNVGRALELYVGPACSYFLAF